MAFSAEISNEIYKYCNNHLAEENWYENEFSFVKDDALRTRLVEEFRAIRFAYKIYEGIAAKEENLIFEVRNQILGYATLYEAVIEQVLTEYYSDTPEFDDLMHHTIPVQISIPLDKQKVLKTELSHNGEIVVPFSYRRKKKEKPQVRFDEKCRTAEKLGIIKPFTNMDGIEVDLPSEIIEIYSYRNGIHLIAEQRKGITYELDLSKRAYRRMRPFIEQVKSKLIEDGKI